MTITTLSSREFNQSASEAKRLADTGPVFITDRGRPAHVLLSIADYRRLTDGPRSIAEMLAMDGAENVVFDAPRATDIARPADFS